MRRTELENAIEDAILSKKQIPDLPITLAHDHLLVFGLRMRANSGIVLAETANKDDRYIVTCVIKGDEDLIGKAVCYNANHGDFISINGVKFAVIHKNAIYAVYHEIEAAQF